jgi:hypothetical protein
MSSVSFYKLYFTINEKVVLDYLISEPINENQVPNTLNQELENFKVCNSKNSKSVIENTSNQDVKDFKHIYKETIDNNSFNKNTEIKETPTFFSENFKEDLREFYNSNSHLILKGRGGAKFFVQFAEVFHNYYLEAKEINFLTYDYKNKTALVSIISKIERTSKRNIKYKSFHYINRKNSIENLLFRIFLFVITKNFIKVIN